MNKIKLVCPFCKSKEVIKAGKRIDKYQQIQRLMCKSCNKSFTASSSKHKTYPSKIILNAISYYNLGHSQSEASRILAQKFKFGVPQKTISNWLKEYKPICTFSRLRKQSIALYSHRIRRQQDRSYCPGYYGEIPGACPYG